MLEPLQGQSGFVRRKSKDASPGKRVVLTVKIDAGVVTAVMEDSPHVRTDPSHIENIVQSFVDRSHRRNGVVVAIVRDV